MEKPDPEHLLIIDSMEQSSSQSGMWTLGPGGRTADHPGQVSLAAGPGLRTVLMTESGQRSDPLRAPPALVAPFVVFQLAEGLISSARTSS